MKDLPWQIIGGHNFGFLLSLSTCHQFKVDGSKRKYYYYLLTTLHSVSNAKMPSRPEEKSSFWNTDQRIVVCPQLSVNNVRHNNCKLSFLASMSPSREKGNVCCAELEAICSECRAAMLKLEQHKHLDRSETYIKHSPVSLIYRFVILCFASSSVGSEINSYHEIPGR